MSCLEGGRATWPPLPATPKRSPPLQLVAPLHPTPRPHPPISSDPVAPAPFHSTARPPPTPPELTSIRPAQGFQKIISSSLVCRSSFLLSPSRPPAAEVVQADGGAPSGARREPWVRARPFWVSRAARWRWRPWRGGPGGPRSPRTDAVQATHQSRVRLGAPRGAGNAACRLNTAPRRRSEQVSLAGGRTRTLLLFRIRLVADGSAR